MRDESSISCAKIIRLSEGTAAAAFQQCQTSRISQNWITLRNIWINHAPGPSYAHSQRWRAHRRAPQAYRAALRDSRRRQRMAAGHSERTQINSFTKCDTMRRFNSLFFGLTGPLSRSDTG